MPLLDAGDAFETGNRFLGFRAFVGNPGYRGRVLTRWHDAGRMGKARLAFEGVVATAIGIGLPLAVIWFVLA